MTEDALERNLRQDTDPDEGLRMYHKQTPFALGIGVVSAAFDIFEGAGCPMDFCFQHISSNGTSISVFGSTNRLRFNPNPSHGPAWDYSPPHCTDKFIAHCESLGIPAR